jgi:hypothetical protein
MKPVWKFCTVLSLLTLTTLYLVDTNLAVSNRTDPQLVFEVSEPAIPKLSLPVHSLPPAEKSPIANREIESLQWFGQNVGESGHPTLSDSLAPFGINTGITPNPLLTFEGLGTDGSAPPDPVGDVGPNHFVQMVNVSFQIWDKGDPDNGTPPSLLQPDTPFNQLFTGFGGYCETRNDGNPIVLYDDQADRWLLSQYALGETKSLCVAVSASPDPTETYNLYEFPMPPYPDSPKLSVWHDAYYVGTNSGLPDGYSAHALDRAKMLGGLPATRQSFLGLANFVMPADSDGPIPPPVGEPGIFYTIYAEGFETHPPGVDRLAIYEFDVDWQTPDNSTFTLAVEIPIAGFNYTVCGFSFAALECIPQPETPQTLDSRSNWPMFRFQYRSFGPYASLVGNFTVDLNDTNKAAIRWFEVRKTGDTFGLYQEGTYAPDEDHRWMGSIAMDTSGNIALGYSVSGINLNPDESTKPSIRYATRLASDPPGTLSAEAELWAGTGVQTGLVRWGDYVNLVVDPVNGCHFWFTSQYHDLDDTGFNWNTRIGIFKIPSCGGNTGTLTGQVTDGIIPLPDAQIQARAAITQSGTTMTDENGSYALSLSEGTYVVTATAYGYTPGIATGVEIISGTTTLQNFMLSLAPLHLITGTVYDAKAGWPLYAKIHIDGYPENPIWTNPATGKYSVTLPEGSYTFEIIAWDEGYLPKVEEVSVEDALTIDFAMTVNTDTCNAAGYVFDGVVESFDSGEKPPGWEVIDYNPFTPPEEWRFDDPGGRGNLTGGTGLFTIMDSDFYGPAGVGQDTALITPPLDFSELSDVYLAFDTDFKIWDGNETNEKADVDVCTDSVDVCMDSAESWTTVWHREQEDGSYNGHVVLDISPIAAQEPEVLIRFHYFDASYDFWWQVDNAAYGALTCDPVPGGLIVGNVYDANTITPLNDISVLHHTTISTTTTATPNDPTLDDGFYSLFSPGGVYTLTAIAAHYGVVTHTGFITNRTAIQQNFYLPAGWLVPTPSSLTLWLGFGYSATLPLRLDNAGGISAAFAIVEDQLSFPDIPWLTASPLTGTLPANTILNALIVLDTTFLTQTGVYSASLIIENNTPYGEISIPITLLTGEPAPSVTIDPDVAGVSAPGTILNYTLSITNTGNVPETFDIKIQEDQWETTLGITTVFLNPGSTAEINVYVAIPITAGYLESDTITLVITGINTSASASINIKTTAQYPFQQFLPFMKGVTGNN